MVLQDDIEPCNNFIWIINQIAMTHPDCAVTGLSISYLPRHKDRESPYHLVPDLCGCAIMLPVAIIAPCMDWCDRYKDEDLKLHDDLMITQYCRAHKIPMLTVIPNIVQHLDNGSLLPYEYGYKRVSSFYEQYPQANWACVLIQK